MLRNVGLLYQIRRKLSLGFAGSARAVCVVAALGALGLFCLGSIARADQGFVLQGLLRSSAGTKIPDGSYSMRFKIKDVNSGVVVWNKVIASVPVANGVFSSALSGNDDLNVPLLTAFTQAPVLGALMPG
ncbi:MAG: hypothetical protein RJB38_1416, partial [Pseudomonadota bacterium]